MSTIKQNLALWEQQINEREKSGMKVKEWCNKHGIRRSQYYYWYSRVHKTSNTNQIQSPDFAEISPDLFTKTNVAPTEILTSSDFQIIFNGIKVIVPSIFQEESLAGLMRVLQKL